MSDPETWPLARGETLSNHDWFPFYGHLFLASGFVAGAVMQGRRGDIGTAAILWAEAFRQDPAGTLPDDDTALAVLAKFPSVEAWREVRRGVLHGWVPVQVEDAETGEVVLRLGHPGLIERIVCEMYKRKRGRDAARDAARLAVRKVRLRKKMAEIGTADHIVADDRALHALADHFERADLYITADNVRAAMAEVLGYTGQVTPFPRGSKG